LPATELRSHEALARVFRFRRCRRRKWHAGFDG
jgi:hypothetical protein